MDDNQSREPIDTSAGEPRLKPILGQLWQLKLDGQPSPAGTLSQLQVGLPESAPDEAGLTEFEKAFEQICRGCGVPPHIFKGEAAGEIGLPSINSPWGFPPGTVRLLSCKDGVAEFQIQSAADVGEDDDCRPDAIVEAGQK